MRLTLDIVETFNDEENESEIKITYTWMKQSEPDDEEIVCAIEHHPLSNNIRDVNVKSDLNRGCAWERKKCALDIDPISIEGKKTGNPCPVKSAFIELSYKHNLRSASRQDGKQAFLITGCSGSGTLDTEVTYSLIYPPLPFLPNLWFKRNITFFEKTPRVIQKANKIYHIRKGHIAGFKHTLHQRESIGPIIGVVEKTPRLSGLPGYLLTGLISAVGGSSGIYFRDNIVQWLKQALEILSPGKQ